MKCNNCGNTNRGTNNFCEYCGAKLKEENITSQAILTNSQTTVNNGNFGWSILGFFFPLVGLILFITWKSSKPKDAKKAGLGALVGGILSIFLSAIFFISFVSRIIDNVSQGSTCENYCSDGVYNDGVCTCPNGQEYNIDNNHEDDYGKINPEDFFELSSEMIEWSTSTAVYSNVVSVVSSSNSSHCQEYKPIIEELAQRNNFKLYWFESDQMNEKDLNFLLTYYNLKDYEGYTPYTFITNKNKFIDSETGYVNEEQIIKFLKTNSVIE